MSSEFQNRPIRVVQLKGSVQTQFAPLPQLAQDVKCFWHIEEIPSIYNGKDVIPDSYMELIVNVGAPLTVETEAGERIDLPRVFLNPLQKRPLRFRVQGLCQILGMRLYPWAVSSFFNISVEQTRMPMVALPDTLWQDMGRMLEWTVQHRGYHEAIDCFQQFINEVCYQTRPDFASMRNAGRELYEAGGQLRMTDLATRFHLSSSQFERRFKQATSVSPKTYARLVRFQSSYYTLWNDPLRSAADLVHAHGYTDQSHFIHEFKAFSGHTPREFATKILERDRQIDYAAFLQYN